MESVDLTLERATLIAKISDAFRGIDRRDGIAWNRDGFEPGGGIDWPELVDDLGWDESLGQPQSFNDLDPIGYRYYLAPAMVRALLRDEGWSLLYSLRLWNEDDHDRLARWEILDQDQATCVAHYLLFMARVTVLAGDDDTSAQYAAAFRDYWSRYSDEAAGFLEMKQALISEIMEAFKGVTRQGGVSWQQSKVADMYGSPEEWKQAEREEKDTQWQQLLEDPNFDVSSGIGGFSFLDPIGWRYYAPPAMIRWIHGDEAEFFMYNVCSDSDYTREQQSLLDQAQRRCVVHFLECVCAEEVITGDFYHGKMARKALERYWLKVAEEPNSKEKTPRNKRAKK